MAEDRLELLQQITAALAVRHERSGHWLVAQAVEQLERSTDVVAATLNAGVEAREIVPGGAR